MGLCNETILSFVHHGKSKLFKSLVVMNIMGCRAYMRRG